MDENDVVEGSDATSEPVVPVVDKAVEAPAVYPGKCPTCGRDR